MFVSLNKKPIMRKILLVLGISVIAIGSASAQGVERQMKTSPNASQVYLELFGPGIFYSLNYDGRFAKMENGLGFRVGLGGAGGNGGGYLALPAQLNYLLGNNGQYLELGAGATFITAGVDLLDDEESGSTVFGTATIGFRKQPFGKKGLTWRLAFTPFVGEFGFLPFGGASIGYRF
jgi:hypothetical protein